MPTFAEGSPRAAWFAIALTSLATSGCIALPAESRPLDPHELQVAGAVAAWVAAPDACHSWDDVRIVEREELSDPDAAGRAWFLGVVGARALIELRTDATGDDVVLAHECLHIVLHCIGEPADANTDHRSERWSRLERELPRVLRGVR